MIKCPRKGCKNKATLHPTFGVLPCDICLAKDALQKTEDLPQFATISQGERVRTQRDKNAKDILQPFNGNKINPEFAKAYPNRVKDYYSEDQLESL